MMRNATAIPITEVAMTVATPSTSEFHSERSSTVGKELIKVRKGELAGLVREGVEENPRERV